MNEPEAMTIEPAGGGCLLARLHGDRLQGMAALNAVRQQLREVIGEAETPKIAIDLADVKFVSSGFMGILAVMATKATEKGGRIAVFGMNQTLADLFEQVDLPKLVAVCGDADEAIAALG